MTGRLRSSSDPTSGHPVIRSSSGPGMTGSVPAVCDRMTGSTQSVVVVRLCSRSWLDRKMTGSGALYHLRPTSGHRSTTRGGSGRVGWKLGCPLLCPLSGTFSPHFRGFAWYRPQTRVTVSLVLEPALGNTPASDTNPSDPSPGCGASTVRLPPPSTRCQRAIRPNNGPFLICRPWQIERAPLLPDSPVNTGVQWRIGPLGLDSETELVCGLRPGVVCEAMSLDGERGAGLLRQRRQGTLRSGGHPKGSRPMVDGSPFPFEHSQPRANTDGVPRLVRGLCLRLADRRATPRI